jgi:hypothetical protein
MSSRRRSAMGSTAEPPPTAAAPHLGSRVVRPGSRLAAPVAGAVLALALPAVSVGVLLSRHSGPRASLSAPAARYGGLPSWLSKPTVPVSRVVHASRAHPALAIEGDAVSVDLGRGRVLATAVGPSVPKTGQFPVRATSPCTFIVTFAAASGVIPLRATAFTLIDQLGHVRHPRVTGMGGGAPPTHVSPGRGVSLSLYDVLPTGNGSLTWAPGGGRPIVTWDFAVEID